MRSHSLSRSFSVLLLASTTTTTDTNAVAILLATDCFHLTEEKKNKTKQFYISVCVLVKCVRSISRVTPTQMHTTHGRSGGGVVVVVVVGDGGGA